MKLNKTTKEFILNNFFKNPEYAGWKNIAETLLDNGSCVVAGTKPIWVGGIGNFIDFTTPDEFIGCTRYHFDLEEFLKSAWFKEIAEHHLSKLNQEKILLESEIDSLQNILGHM